MIDPTEELAEIRVLAAADAAFAEARRRAGPWLACRPGCDQCCRRPFAITAHDTRRLRQGLAALPEPDQTEIRERAAQARARMANDFPGDLTSGTLSNSVEWRQWFFSRHAGLPCPVLNLETGTCRLYAYRPIACRLAGPLIQIGSSSTDPCPLCFVGISEEQILTTKIVIQLAEFEVLSDCGETVISLIL